MDKQGTRKNGVGSFLDGLSGGKENRHQLFLPATNTSTNDTWTYTYDFRNRLTGAVEKNAQNTVLAQVTYTYGVHVSF